MQPSPETVTNVLGAANGAASTLDAAAILHLLHTGGLTVYPLAVCSVVGFAIVIERLWRYWGLVPRTRDLTKRIVDALARRDIAEAQTICAATKHPMAEVFLDGLRWKNIALEDLERVLDTSKNEAVTDLKRGLWVLGTIGSLAPFVGLFGTVVGIMRAFHEMARQGVGGFEVVAAGISEALIATAAGLAVAIVALAFYNYMQVRVSNIASTFTRAAERFVQALLYVESAGTVTSVPTPEGVPGGHQQPA